MHPSPPAEHEHAGHPTLRRIAEAVRGGREVWSVKELQDVFPGMSTRFYYELTSGRLEATAHCTTKEGQPTYRITTRSIILYFLETTSGLSQEDIVRAMSLIMPHLSRKALVWLRGCIDRHLHALNGLSEVALPGEAEKALKANRRSREDPLQTQLF
jgi:hypothetical protein